MLGEYLYIFTHLDIQNKKNTLGFGLKGSLKVCKYYIKTNLYTIITTIQFILCSLELST